MLALLLLASSIYATKLWPRPVDSEEAEGVQVASKESWDHLASKEVFEDGPTISAVAPLQSLVPEEPFTVGSEFSMSLERSVFIIHNAPAESVEQLQFELVEDPAWLRMTHQGSKLTISGVLQSAGTHSFSLVASLPALGVSNTFPMELSVEAPAPTPQQPTHPRFWWENWSLKEWPPSPLVIATLSVLAIVVLVVGFAALSPSCRKRFSVFGRRGRRSFFDSQWVHVERDHSDLQSVLNPPPPQPRRWVPALHLQSDAPEEPEVQQHPVGNYPNADSHLDHGSYFGGLTYSPLFDFTYGKNPYEQLSHHSRDSRDSLNSLFAAQEQHVYAGSNLGSFDGVVVEDSDNQSNDHGSEAESYYSVSLDREILASPNSPPNFASLS